MTAPKIPFLCRIGIHLSPRFDDWGDHCNDCGKTVNK